ncbi:MAG: NAD(P)/FAD-dependent oxidoreductase [Cyanobacteria bacterium]|nr:NAD(P)/FAD-dependent oxidoreductase [Cyanobacteriota bacterium]
MSRMEIIVVGGGAAGCFGAIAAAEAAPQAQITLLEAAPAPLGKVKISGGGRCNVTHHCFDPALLVQHYPRGGKALRGPLTRFQPRDTVAWFDQRGVRLKVEGDGRMFPVTDDSATILDCLLGEAQRLGITLRTRCPVQAIAPLGDPAAAPFRVTLRSGESLRCDRLLLATGSSPQGHRLAQALGHTLIPPVPSLFTFNVRDKALQALAGVAMDPVAVKLTVTGAKPLSQTGPLLIPHWGLSGPAVLKLSAWGARLLYDQGYRAELTVNWLPGQPLEALGDHLQTLRQTAPKRAIARQSPVPIPRRLWQYLVARSGLAADLTWANLPKVGLHRLLEELHRGRYPVAGKGAFKEEFVTCGGVKLAEVDFKTMASRRCPGLFLAGELLDIDGVTGGFNFQSAWTTGWLAGQALGSTSPQPASGGS